jgi:hypothetical protein
MFAINKLAKGLMTSPKFLKNLQGHEVELLKGERVNLLSITSAEGLNYFGIQKKSKGIIVLPQALFNNNFNLFQKGI